MSSKRRHPSGFSGSRKKIKIQHNSTKDLPWKSVSRPSQAGIDFDDGILELEEVDDVEVVYEETDNGKVARFNVLREDADEEDVEEEEEWKGITTETPPIESDNEEEPQLFDSETLLPDWHPYSFHPQLLSALHAQKFTTPTPIQAAAIPLALNSRDVIGVAQTGSGKTLAYGLPILNHLLSQPRTQKGIKRSIKALILAPTRELALQISSHLNKCLNPVEPPSTKQGNKIPRQPPKVSVAAIVGGMSAQKQRRILDRGVDVLVATPGRLWDLLEEDDDLARQLKKLKYLVLDEADRMIETGHFQELEKILRLTLRQVDEDHIEGDQMTREETELSENNEDSMQTLIFSATLSRDLQRNVKRRSHPTLGKFKHKSNPASTLDELLLRLDFRDAEPQVIDLSPEHGVVSTLKEGKIECLSADKDTYLYYFLLRYPGRTLVFLSSVDGIRRMLPLFELLNIKAFPLHSQMEQRQRLKNLDRFKSITNSVLLATDIAARGLDIPSVDHVVHYQIPRSSDVYIHRNGRTARAMRDGFSLLMCAPDERRVVRALLGNIGRQDQDIPEIPMDLGMLDKLKARVNLARKIETSLHRVKKANHDRNWMKETANAMDIELDSDYLSGSDDERPSKQKKKAKDHQISGMKAELKSLLSQPLVPKGISPKYITSGLNPLVDNLLSGQHNEVMLGVGKGDIAHDLATSSKPSRKKSKS